MIHFAKMGLDNLRDGIFNQDNVDYSMSIPTVKERNRRNIEIIKTLK